MLRENLDVEKVLGEHFALVMIPEEGLAMVGQRLEGRGMKNQMEFWDLHLESIICILSHSSILHEINIPSLN